MRDKVVSALTLIAGIGIGIAEGRRLGASQNRRWRSVLDLAVLLRDPVGDLVLPWWNATGR
jgi:hypothetical protein